MQKVILVAVIGLGLIGLSELNTQAQMNTNPPPTLPGLGTQVMGFFTSFNTNLDTTFADNRGSLWTTAISEQGGVAPLLNEFGGSYDILRPAAATETHTAVFLEGRERNTGVSGTISSLQGGVGFAVLVHDVRLNLSLDGGYNLERSTRQTRGYGEVGFSALKALGTHWATGPGFFAQFPNKVQGLFVELRATF